MFAFFCSYFKTRVKHENITSLLLSYEPLFTSDDITGFSSKAFIFEQSITFRTETHLFLCVLFPPFFFIKAELLWSRHIYFLTNMPGEVSEKKKGAHRKRARSKLTTSLTFFLLVRR